MATRKPILSVLALLLAMCLLAAGTSVSAPWLWQCRHASQMIAAAPAASPNAMPCRMAGMSPMPCCRTMARVAPALGRLPALRPAPCHPTLSPTALLSASGLSPLGPDARRSASADAAPLPFTPGLRPAPALSAPAPRPPPSGSLPASPPLRSPHLRAPPVA